MRQVRFEVYIVAQAWGISPLSGLDVVWVGAFHIVRVAIHGGSHKRRSLWRYWLGAWHLVGNTTRSYQGARRKSLYLKISKSYKTV